MAKSSKYTQFFLVPHTQTHTHTHTEKKKKKKRSKETHKTVVVVILSCQVNDAKYCLCLNLLITPLTTKTSLLYDFN